MFLKTWAQQRCIQECRAMSSGQYWESDCDKKEHLMLLKINRYGALDKVAKIIQSNKPSHCNTVIQITKDLRLY